MKKIYLIIILILDLLYASAQTTKITGTIIDKDSHQPLQGASIILKKNAQYTISNIDGHFTIPLTRADTLVVTHLGYERLAMPVSSANSSQLLISMKSTYAQLKEVTVSTGYQTLPKERATGSFTQIDNKTFNEQVSTDVISRLEAVANSVSVSRKTAGNTAQLMVRGLSTIQGVKQPLIIVDNFPYDGDINNINPNDVQDITILKDAAAASVWGTKAGNGVIVITTKKGKFNQRTTVEGNAITTITEKPNLFYLPQMSSTDFINVEQFLFSKGYRFSDTASTSHPPFSPVYEILLKQQNGQLSQAAATGQINALRNIDIRNDLNKYFYQKAVNQQYSVNINGGSNNIAWLVFAGYDKNINELNAKNDRLNIRTQNTFSLAKNLQLSIGALYTQTNNTSGKPSYSDISTSIGSIPPYTQIADANGNALPIAKDYRLSYINSAGSGKLLDWNYYPLTDYQHVNNAIKGNDLLANLGLNYKITSWLNADVKYQFEKQQITNNILYDANSYYTRNLINQFTQIDPTYNTVLKVIPKGGIYDLSTNNITSNDVRGQLNFNKTSGKFDINAIAGGEISQKASNQNSYRVYGYDGNILTTTNVDYANSYPTYIQGIYSFIPSNVDFLKNLNRYVSTYANTALTYDEKYTLSLSGRRDASNLFGVSTNNKWTPLWSSGLSWDISKEKFYNSKLIPYLKLRATYGFSGNINPDATAVTTVAYNITSPYTQTPTAVIDKFYNPDLRWEKVGILNIGLDFKMLNNRIIGSLEYYRKNATDLFGSVPVDYTVGLVNTTIVKNVASMQGNGADLELNSINFNGAVKWLTSINLSYYRDKVTNYYLSSYQGSNFVNGGQLIAGVVGKPVYSIFSYKWAGLDPATGDPQGYLNGQVSKDYLNITGSGTTINDLKYNGPAFPVIFGSMGNTVSYKNLSITARVLYKFGYYFQRQSISYSSLFANSAGHADYSLRWQKPGDEKTTNVPSMTYPADPARDAFYNGSEVLVDRADNIRLQYININYSFKLRPSTSGFNRLQAFIVLNNLGIIWKATHAPVDPDYNSSVIPPSKSISLGIKGRF
ncbi:SusC/RagA family TonB-linked outer membrane protein [Mucilaginibacter sp. RCC_168]|uniref:SusC/RagA family TonB-linked outer membrane protein n=1 Tax=Mucilaginibacter sp. RCC_168 TaxID=3239221 RepID=UPI003525F43D